jgi:hypothetical protein
MTNWLCNNGDGLATGYWAIAPWKRATSYATNSIVRQRGGVITIGIALDFTNSKTWFIDLTNNGQWDDTTDDPGTNTGGLTTTVTGALFPAVTTTNYAVTTANFGASALSAPTYRLQFGQCANGSAAHVEPRDKNANCVLSGGNLTSNSAATAATISVASHCQLQHGQNLIGKSRSVGRPLAARCRSILAAI